MHVVTGGAGYLGGHLVRRLVEKGEVVRVIERPGIDRARLEGLDVEWVEADIRDREAVRRAVRGAKRVYHLAANPQLWTQDRDEFDRVNHLGAVHVIRESLDAGAERILHTSTESILTCRTPPTEPIETRRLREPDMLGPYCVSKFRAEEFAWNQMDVGAPVLLANPTLPVGPGDWGQSPPTRMTLAFLRGKLPAIINAQVNLIDARDVAMGLEAVMDRGVPLRRYVLGAENRNLAYWLSLVGQEVGRPAPGTWVPIWLGHLAAMASEAWADWVRHEIPQATRTGVQLAARSMHLETQSTWDVLGVTPRPLQESARDAVAWYRQIGWI